jgi:hypothetical protein
MSSTPGIDILGSHEKSIKREMHISVMVVVVVASGWH